MKLEKHQEIQLSLCFRRDLQLSQKQIEQGLNQQQKHDLEYFKQRKRELLNKMKREYE